MVEQIFRFSKDQIDVITLLCHLLRTFKNHSKVIISLIPNTLTYEKKINKTVIII